MKAFLLAALLLPLTAQQTTQPVQDTIAVQDWEADQHLIGDPPFLRVGRDLAGRMRFSSIEVQVTVDAGGSVIAVDSSAMQGSDREIPPETIAAAESLVRLLRFRPFERDGHPVTAKFQEDVFLLPPEVVPVRNLPFPKVTSLKLVKITLQRSGCFGTCPAYGIVVRGDGTVEYDGEGYVAFTGHHRGTVPKENVLELLKLFKASDYYSLDDEYSMSVTDQATYHTSIEVNGKRKAVRDYVGLEVGMPLAVMRLENEIDRLSGSERWIKGNAGTVAALNAEHWDFKSGEATATLARIVEAGGDDVARDLINAGVSLVAKDTSAEVLPPAARRGDIAMLTALIGAGAAADTSGLDMALPAAAQSGNVEAFRLLLRSGARLDARDPFGYTVLMCATASGNPAMLKEVLKYQPEVNAAVVRPHAGPEAFPGADSGEGMTALMEASSQSAFSAAPEGAERAEIVRLLLEAGADPNVRNKHGNTALMLCTKRADIALLLIKAGADVNATNDEGKSALSMADNDDLKRVLIEHGAEEK